MIYEFGRWEVPVANRERHREIMEAIYANIRSNRARFSYLRSSRIYAPMYPEGSRDEVWMYLDAYEDEDNYRRMSRALLEDKQAAALRSEWERLIVPGSFRTELWADLAAELWIE